METQHLRISARLEQRLAVLLVVLLRSALETSVELGLQLRNDGHGLVVDIASLIARITTVLRIETV